MNLPDTSTLPLSSVSKSYDFDHQKIQAFQKAFKASEDYYPITMGAGAMDGMFALVEQMGLGPQNLLHLSQSIEILKPLEIPSRVTAQTSLVKLRSRSSVHWATFETLLWTDEKSSAFCRHESLVLMREESELQTLTEAEPKNVESLKSLTFDPIDQDQIQHYAEASGDHNPIHLNSEHAKGMGLPSTIAHGMLSMGLAAYALEQWGYSNRKIQNFSAKFKQMVPVGDQLTAHLIKEDSNGHVEAVLLNQKGLEIMSFQAQQMA